MKRILYVSHCLLNTAAKVEMYHEEEARREEELRVEFLRAALEKGVQLIQLPCPEFTLYGAKRWGHVYDQFDNPFFRAHCRRLLEPVLLQMKEYSANPEKFALLGAVGVDGSPSCGVAKTCRGEWGGELSGRCLSDAVGTIRVGPGNGVFFEVLDEMLKENGIVLKTVGLSAGEKEKTMSILD